MSLISDLSIKEQKANDELQHRLKNELRCPLLKNDETVFWRFLKARDFNVDKAEKMLRKSIAWRKAFQVDTILQDFTPRPFFVKYRKFSHIGFDKNGNILEYTPAGKQDAIESLKCATMNDYIKHWIWHMERLTAFVKDLEEKTGRGSYLYTFIIDLDTFTLASTTNKLALEVLVQIINIMQDNYPQYLNAAYFINSPAYFGIVYSILKAILSNVLLQKLHIFGQNGWKEELLKFVDPDVLPAFLGGNRTDPDGNPLCTTFINHSGRITVTHFLPEEERYFKDTSQVKQIIIPARQKKEITVPVTANASHLQWEFLIKNKTIGFGLFYRVSELELEEILPIHTVKTIDGVEKGSYKTNSNGEYIIIFDNSYSWWNSKEIEYYIKVLRPRI